MNALPVEIIENILLKCDGKTLLMIKKIDDQWYQIVDYITKKSEIWRWCCNEEIPKNELVEYCQKYNGNFEDYRKWLSIYQNWCSWQNLKDINCGINATPVEMSRISCMAVSGNYIAIGSEDGRLKIYKTTWALVHSARHLAVKVKGLSFVKSGTKEKEELCILIAYAKGLVISAFNSGDENEVTVYDVEAFSVFENYICYKRVGGRTTICKLLCINGRIQLEEVWFSRIYSPTNVWSLKMWNGTCTFLINNDIKYVNYVEPDISPMEALKVKTKIDFSFTSRDSSYYTQSRVILRDDVIINIYKNDDQEKSDFIEFFFLNENNGYSTKLFNSWEIFSSTITCIFVYGNTLIVGVDIGNIYMYHVSSWKNLNLRNHDRKIIVGKHPIISIDVKEDGDERRFYIASRFCVHQLTGFSVIYK